MRALLLLLLLLSLPALAQEVREASRLDQSLEGPVFVVHWSDSDDLALADAGRVLALLDRARLRAEARGWPEIAGAAALKIDVIVDPSVDLFSVGLHEEEPVMPHLRLGAGFFDMPEEDQALFLAMAYPSAVLLSDDCEVGQTWGLGMAAAFARPLATGSSILADIARLSVEDGGRFGDAGNIYLLLVYTELVVDAPLLGPAVSACAPENPLGRAFDAAAVSALGEGAADLFAGFFAELTLERAVLPDDIQAMLGPPGALEGTRIFESRFEELGAGGFVAYAPAAPAEIEVFVDDPRLRVMSAARLDGAWRGRTLEAGDELLTGTENLLVFFNPGFDDEGLAFEWMLTSIDFGDDFFFEEECELDPCACFGECGPGPCAGSGLPRSAPWGLAALLLLVTGTARAGARRRRGSGPAAGARRARPS